MSQTTPFSTPSSQTDGMFSPVSIQPGRGHLVDEMMAIGAIIILPLQFEYADFLRLPFAGLFALYMAANWRSVAPVLMRAKWFFALPVLCIISGIWAENSVAAVYFGILLTVSMMVAVGLAARLDPRQLTIAVLLSQGLLAIASALTMTKVWIGGMDGGYALIGVFSHKNVLGQRMVFLILAALVVMLSAGYRPIFRLLALPLMLLAAGLLAQAMSATALILLAAMVPLGVGLALLWRPAVSVRGLRPAIVFGGFASVALGLLVMTNWFGVSPIEDALAMFGKDKSLTGRTVIWAAGNEMISQNPVLGVGAGNFWHADNPTAVRLADQFYKADGRFRFHSAYYEATVHLGIIGLALVTWLYMRGVFLTVGSWWRNQKGTDLFLILVVAVLFIRSFTESEMFSPLRLGPILFWTAAFYGLLLKPEACKAIRP